jgi:hypothetical protein
MLADHSTFEFVITKGSILLFLSFQTLQIFVLDVYLALLQEDPNIRPNWSRSVSKQRHPRVSF